MRPPNARGGRTGPEARHGQQPHPGQPGPWGEGGQLWGERVLLKGLMWMRSRVQEVEFSHDRYPSIPMILSTLGKHVKAHSVSTWWVGSKVQKQYFQKTKQRPLERKSLQVSCLWLGTGIGGRRSKLKSLFSEKQVKFKHGTQHSRHWYGVRDHLKPV